jgi:hypothetical protein
MKTNDDDVGDTERELVIKSLMNFIKSMIMWEVDTATENEPHLERTIKAKRNVCNTISRQREMERKPLKSKSNLHAFLKNEAGNFSECENVWFISQCLQLYFINYICTERF